MSIIPPIQPITAGVANVGAASRTSSTPAAELGGTPDSFGSSLTGALDDLDASQKATDELARAAATGDLQHVEDLMVASTETQLTTQLTVAVRNKAVEAFNDIMRMQL